MEHHEPVTELMLLTGESLKYFLTKFKHKKEWPQIPKTELAIHAAKNRNNRYYKARIFAPRLSYHTEYILHNTLQTQP